MASVLTHKKVPEWGGFNWDSPRQRHRFCYIADGGASFFQIWVTKTQADRNKKIHKIFKQIQNKKAKSHRSHIHRLRTWDPTEKNSSDFAAGTMIQQIFATQSALSRSEVFWFSFRYPKDFFSSDLSCAVCTPMIRGISLQIHFFVFFSAYLFQMGSEEKKIFRSFGVQICTTPIRRFFNTLDPTDF